jgi:hypothetical protein
VSFYAIAEKPRCFRFNNFYNFVCQVAGYAPKVFGCSLGGLHYRRLDRAGDDDISGAPLDMLRPNVEGFALLG